MLNSYQDKVAKQMKGEILHVARDVNDINCLDLVCENCPFWVSEDCMLGRIKEILKRCLNNE